MRLHFLLFYAWSWKRFLNLFYLLSCHFVSAASNESGGQKLRQRLSFLQLHHRFSLALARREDIAGLAECAEDFLRSYYMLQAASEFLVAAALVVEMLAGAL